MKLLSSGLMGLALTSLFATSAGAGVITTYGFPTRLTNGGPNVGSQLTVDVEAAALNSTVVDFTFRNAGPLASSITDIYFEDGTLLGISTITNSAGVEFAVGASPGNLPSGQTASPPFQATAGFTADSTSPTQPNGVNPGEWVKITFNLINGRTYANTIAAIAAGAVDGGLRMGIHVQGLSNGGSDSYINGPNPVPDPSSVPDGGTTAMMLGGALLAIAGVRRKFSI
jgi:hypothetical protein